MDISHNIIILKTAYSFLLVLVYFIYVIPTIFLRFYSYTAHCLEICTEGINNALGTREF